MKNPRPLFRSVVDLGSTMTTNRAQQLLLMLLLLVGTNELLATGLPDGGTEDGFAGRPVPSAPDCEIVATHANGSKGFERLQGNAARSHLRNLMSRHPGRFEKAARILTEKGFRRTDDVVVLRGVTLGATETATRLDAARPSAYRVSSSSSSEGEIVFVSWDDGDPSTWEGSIYMASYVPAADLLTDVQFDISDVIIDAVWEEVVYVNPRNSDPWNQEMRKVVSDTNMGAIRAPVEAGERDTANTDPPPPPPPPTPKSPARLWVECAVKGCAGGAIGCAFSGLAWPVCFNGTCGAAGMFCALDVALNMIP